MSSLPFPDLLIADASPLIALARIDELKLLPQLFSQILVPHIVAQECLALPHHKDAQLIAEAFTQNILKLDSSTLTPVPLPKGVDAGEWSALQMALQYGAPVLIDDYLGRKAAYSLHIKVIGTIGILMLAKDHGLIKNVTEKFRALQESGYYLGEKLIALAIQMANE